MESETLPRSNLSVTRFLSSSSFSEKTLGKRRAKSRNFEFKLFTSTVILVSPLLSTAWPKPVIDLIMKSYAIRSCKIAFCKEHLKIKPQGHKCARVLHLVIFHRPRQVKLHIVSQHHGAEAKTIAV